MAAATALRTATLRRLLRRIRAVALRLRAAPLAAAAPARCTVASCDIDISAEGDD